MKNWGSKRLLVGNEVGFKVKEMKKNMQTTATFGQEGLHSLVTANKPISKLAHPERK